MHDEFKRIWKDALLALSECHLGSCLEGQGRIMKNRISIDPAKIQTRVLLNSSLECYHYRSLQISCNIQMS
jgi:hypothetical protein